jgi:hypothetical protein
MQSSYMRQPWGKWAPRFEAAPLLVIKVPRLADSDAYPALGTAATLLYLRLTIIPHISCLPADEISSTYPTRCSESDRHQHERWFL